MDTKIRFTSNVAAYNELIVLKLTEGSLSIALLHEAIQLVIAKHPAIQTSLSFNGDDGTIRQELMRDKNGLNFEIEKTFENQKELDLILAEIVNDPKLFDLKTGKVFYYQYLRYRSANKINEENFISTSDILVIAFHHSVSDRTSQRIFLHDLCNAYCCNKLSSIDKKSLQYIDYSVYERLLDMTPSIKFWNSQLDGYNLEHYLQLPQDRQRLFSHERSVEANVIEFAFDKDLSSSFLMCASRYNVTPFQLGLATFYVFLFQLTNGEKDLCISCINANRYRPELVDLIGMFASMLPYRIQINQQYLFEAFVKVVQNQCLAILEHSQCPLQYVLGSSQHRKSTAAFLEIVFDFIILAPDFSRFSLQGAELELLPSRGTINVAKYDLMLTLVQKKSSLSTEISCSLICSRDLFDQTTVEQIAHCYHALLNQLFSLDIVVQSQGPTLKSFIAVPYSQTRLTGELHRIMFRRSLVFVNEGMYFNSFPSDAYTMHLF